MMPKTENMTESHSPSQDLATILSNLPRGGAGDDAARLVEVYESAERVYRAASLAGTPAIGSSSSANG
jgi:hypothetical protein